MKTEILEQRNMNLRRVLIWAARALVPLVLLVLILRTRGRASPDHQEFREKVAAASKIWGGATASLLTPDTISRICNEIPCENSGLLDGDKEAKLRLALKRFFECYTQTNFAAFRTLKLNSPYVVGKDLDEYLSSLKGAPEHSDPLEKLRFAWKQMNSTNRITHIDASNMVLRAYQAARFEPVMRRISISRLPQAALLCWNSYVISSPSVEDLEKRGQPILFFSMEQFIRFNNRLDRAANPSTLVGYWNPDTSDWSLWQYCLMLSEGYSTLF